MAYSANGDRINVISRWSVDWSPRSGMMRLPCGAFNRSVSSNASTETPAASKKGI